MRAVGAAVVHLAQALDPVRIAVRVAEAAAAVDTSSSSIVSGGRQVAVVVAVSYTHLTLPTIYSV